MTIYTIVLFLLFFGVILFFIFGGSKKLRLKIKSLNSGEVYTAERKKDSKGNDFLDWFYYDEDGKSIEDETLKSMIFEAFSDEDWYGDYEFYTNTQYKRQAVLVESTKIA